MAYLENVMGFMQVLHEVMSHILNLLGRERMPQSQPNFWLALRYEVTWKVLDPYLRLFLN